MLCKYRIFSTSSTTAVVISQSVDARVTRRACKSVTVDVGGRVRAVGLLSVGSSLSCQLNAAGLQAAAAAGGANSSSKHSSTNFSTSSDNVSPSVDRRALSSPAAADRLSQLIDLTSADDVIEAFPVGGGHSNSTDRQPRRLGRLPTSGHVPSSNRRPVFESMTSRASRPTAWSCDGVCSLLNQRGDVDRSVIASTPSVTPY